MHVLNPYAPGCRAKYLLLPPSLCVRSQSAILIVRLPLIVRATSRARLIPFILHLATYIFARRTRRASPDVGTKDNRWMSCNVRHHVAQPRTTAFFHANLTPFSLSESARLCKKHMRSLYGISCYSWRT